MKQLAVSSSSRFEVGLWEGFLGMLSMSGAMVSENN